MKHEKARCMAEEKFDAFLSQYSDEEQERILRYALDHVLPKYKGRSPAIAAALVKFTDGQKPVKVDAEWLARREQAAFEAGKATASHSPAPAVQDAAEPDCEAVMCDGSRGSMCVHQDPNDCDLARDCPAFISAKPPFPGYTPPKKQAT